MSRDTLARAVLLLAFAAGLTYAAAPLVHAPAGLDAAWKGAGVGLLAVWAALQARRLDGWLIAAVMALGATGDVLIETSGLTVGAVAFLAGHLVAIALYLRNRRAHLTPSQLALALLLVPATVVTAYLLPSDRASAPGIALYATGLSLMAAAAWTSRFPRLRAGMGAILFLVSDLLIFARAGPLAHAAWVSLAIWLLYFVGQLMIAIGVVGAHRARSP